MKCLQARLTRLPTGIRALVGYRHIPNPQLWADRFIRCYNGSFGRLYSNLTKSDATIDGRVRLSRFWVPSGGIAATSTEDSHSKLIRAGFLRQAHSGVFHMLPLGRRVQDKLEALIDRFMSRLGASKLALSSISSEALWARSGRLQSAGPEIFHFRDRKDVGYLLSPTHEEEVTTLVSNTVKSYKELPVRLYQISRKYRDELRPRHGLLRSREFVMKDLYTFDYSASIALETYHKVREVYSSLFDELKLPYLVAEADSGDMGGNLSHEYHFPTSKGEDVVISCNNCEYVANEELAESTVAPENEAIGGLSPHESSGAGVRVWRGISRDRLTLVNVWYPSAIKFGSSAKSGEGGDTEVNVYAVKAVLPELDASIEHPLPLWSHQALVPSSQQGADPSQSNSKRLINLVDARLPKSFPLSIQSHDSELPLWPGQLIGSFPDIEMSILSKDPLTGHPLNLLRIKDGDICPRCPDGKLKVQRAIELGHTFHLGTRYSEPLKAMVTLPAEHIKREIIGAEGGGVEADGLSESGQVAMQMGCHGIGISRMIGAVADTLADEKGLNWPRAMAPFEVVVVPAKDLESAALEVYHALSPTPQRSNEAQLDLVLDDRSESFPWKMRDADLVGYPVIVVVGRRWKAERICEVQCRRLGVHEERPLASLPAFIESLLVQL